jgi:bifunctional non-homologous end joining protein LigD
MDNVTLYFREGSSDKVYQAGIVTKDNGFAVEFAYGRRGTALRADTKTPAPVDYEKAKKIFNALVKEKYAKGYRPGADGQVIAQVENAAKDSGMRPMLLNAVDEEELSQLMEDDDYLLQEKFDGVKLMLSKKEGEVVGANKRGLIIPLPVKIVQDAMAIQGDFKLDAELMGERLVVVDCLEREGDVTSLGTLARWHIAAGFLPLLNMKQPLGLCPWYMGKDDKRAMLEEIQNSQREGVVFKRKDAPYVSGKPSAGQPPYKFKFTADATCQVGEVTLGKRSVSLVVYDDMGQSHTIGRVTIPANKDIPEPGAFVDVQYLYWYRGGCLFQPVYLGERSDAGVEDCTLAQLKAKTENEEE